MVEQSVYLIESAKELLSKYTDNEIHTVAAAVLTESGKVFTSLNLYHFTGGPCAEVAALARVASEGEKPKKIVAVGNNGRGALPPCGRCRQIMFDYYREIKVILSNDGQEKSVEELLPDTYIWNDQ